MKTKLRVCSKICFIAAIPSMVIVDWYLHGYGLLCMFAFACIGLIFDQIFRITYPTTAIPDISLYRKNKIMKLLSLVLFVMSPMALVYGNRFHNYFSTIMFFVFVGIGLANDNLAKTFFSLSKHGNK